MAATKAMHGWISAAVSETFTGLCTKEPNFDHDGLPR
jgi:hypothetical protein